MTDNTKATRQAIDTITATLTRNHGADPEWTARAILWELASLGWRPTHATKPPPWQPSGTPTPPTREWQQARAKLENRP
jgi:hypothetical protein